MIWNDLDQKSLLEILVILVYNRRVPKLSLWAKNRNALMRFLQANLVLERVQSKKTRKVEAK